MFYRFIHLFKAPALLLLILTTLSAACAFEPGEPWGFIESTISLDDDHLQAPPGITINFVQLTPAALRLYNSTPSTGAAKFDPANPPPGYSLCHGGHCHAADGTLPTYAEIEATLAGDSASKNLAATAHFNENLSHAHPLNNELKILQRGTLSNAEIEFSSLHIQATAQHADASKTLTIDIPLHSTQLTSAIDLHIDRDAPHHQTLQLTIELPQDLLASLNLDELTPQSDGTFLINTKNNPDHAAAIADFFTTNAALLVINDHDQEHDHDHDHDH